jgi:hypothetical protein
VRRIRLTAGLCSCYVLISPDRGAPESADERPLPPRRENRRDRLGTDSHCKRCGNEGLAPVRLNRLETRSGLKKVGVLLLRSDAFRLSAPSPRLRRGLGRAPFGSAHLKARGRMTSAGEARKNAGPARRQAPALHSLCNGRKTENRKQSPPLSLPCKGARLDGDGEASPASKVGPTTPGLKMNDSTTTTTND